MKKFKKSIVALSLSTAMLAIAGFGTLAYFTDTETASNSFTVGKVDIGLEEENWEHKEEGESATVIPGTTIPKDPVVTIKEGSLESYIRMVVKMPENVFRASSLNENNTDPLITFNKMDDKVWITSPAILVGDEVTVVFTYNEAVAAPNEDVVLKALFESLIIGADDNNELAEVLGDQFDIDVSAYAVQTEGFKDTSKSYMENVEDAFAAAF